MKIYCQSIVELSTGKIIGAEAKAYLVHDKYGLIRAEQFIPLIEGSELSQQFTSFMLINAIKQLAGWHLDGHKIYISVNLSVQDAIDKKRLS